MAKKKRREPITTRELELAFEFHNEHFFGGKLAPPKVEFVSAKTLDDKDGLTSVGEHGLVIQISSQLRHFPNLCMIVFLHELAHIAQWGTNTLPGAHGMIFSAEIVRLFNAGAYEGLL